MNLSQQQLDFLQKVVEPARGAERAAGIPACVTIAQAIFESATAAGWGTSPLFLRANNPFGIQFSQLAQKEGYGHFDAQSWEIEKGEKKVGIEKFCQFPSLGSAFNWHSTLLRSPRYAPAFSVRQDWQEFAERLGPKTSPGDQEHCGYSTNPGYSAELIQAVNQYRLNDPRALEWYATGKDPGVGARGSGLGGREEILRCARSAPAPSGPPNPVSQVPSPEKSG